MKRHQRHCHKKGTLRLRHDETAMVQKERISSDKHHGQNTSLDRPNANKVRHAKDRAYSEQPVDETNCQPPV